MKEATKSSALSRLEILLIISIACLCLFGLLLFIRPSETTVSTDPNLKHPASESRAVPRRINDAGDTPSPTKASSDFNEMTSYLPADLRYLRFGLTLAEFKAFEANLTYEVFEGVRLHATKKTAIGGIAEITAYFELAEPHVYYELIVVFASGSQRDQSAAALLGNPNFGKDWLIPLKDQKAIHVWKAFEDKLVYQYLPRGVSSVYDDLPSPEQMEELQKLIEEFKEAVRVQNLKK